MDPTSKILFKHYRDNYSNGSLQSTAEQKMKVFFDGLQQFDMQIDRWMIATSPGFCSGHHWQFLVENLTTRINQLNSAQPRPRQT